MPGMCLASHALLIASVCMHPRNIRMTSYLR